MEIKTQDGITTIQEGQNYKKVEIIPKGLYLKDENGHEAIMTAFVELYDIIVVEGKKGPSFMTQTPAVLPLGFMGPDKNGMYTINFRLEGINYGGISQRTDNQVQTHYRAL